MYLDSAKKKELFEKYGKSAADTGSAESQNRTVYSSYCTFNRTLEKLITKDYSTERALKCWLVNVVVYWII